MSVNTLHPLRFTAPTLAGFIAGWMVCGVFTAGPAPTASPAVRVTPSQLAAGSPLGRTGGGAEVRAPFPVRLAWATAEGYASAGEDLTAALRRARETTDPYEGEALTRGIFAWVAEKLPPEEALRLAREPGRPHGDAALEALARQWSGRPDTPEPGGDGAALKIAQALFSSELTPRAAADAWLAAFANDPDRADIARAYAVAYLAKTPEKLLPMAETFTPWERERFLGDTLVRWIGLRKGDPAGVLAWIQGNRERIPSGARAVTLREWARTSPAQALEAAAATGDLSWRGDLIPAVAFTMGWTDTERALAWADSLPGEEERESAHAAIREAAPVGIGAQFSVSSGLPVLEAVFPGRPAAEAGLLPGDRLISVTGADGETVSFDGAGQGTIREHLRGGAEDTVSLRILRRDPAMGTTSELTLPVKRRQLTWPPVRR